VKNYTTGQAGVLVPVTVTYSPECPEIGAVYRIREKSGFLFSTKEKDADLSNDF